MGKPYTEELKSLPSTLAWALQVPLGGLPKAIRAAAGLPLVAVGSGGSYTTAQFAAAAHRRYCSVGASTMTPLEAIATPQSLRQTAVLLATGGGRNPDVLGAFSRLAEREPRRLIVLCARIGSPLARAVVRHAAVDFMDFEPPAGKDGFLATNSLVASALLLVRAYALAYNAPAPLPGLLADLPAGMGCKTSAELDKLCEPLWRCQTLVVLHGPDCHAAAVDVESKFSEAALGNVQLADFRNFAHGRHHWLAKRGGETAVLAISSDGDVSLAEPLLALLPRAVPVVRLRASGSGLMASLSALLQVLFVVGSAGRARGIDPGDPGVPAFGRKIYHLRAFRPRGLAADPLPAVEVAAIERKSNATVETLLARGTLDGWRAAYSTFCTRLAAPLFRGIVLDYDGTLCSEAHRFEPLAAPVTRQFNRLLQTGTVLGIATGRGKSVKELLRAAIKQRFWSRVVIGYYNGGDVALLADNARPVGSDLVGPSLTAVASALRIAIEQPMLAKLTFRPSQITIEPGIETHGDDIWNLVQHIIYTAGTTAIAAVRSSHSIDIVAAGVTKRAVIDRLQELVSGEADTPVLCIGDRGRWPGNDFALLSSPYSLSVDEVSPDPESCWNLAAPGRRGAVAALDYLKRLTTRGGLRWRSD